MVQREERRQLEVQEYLHWLTKPDEPYEQRVRCWRRELHDRRVTAEHHCEGRFHR